MSCAGICNSNAEISTTTLRWHYRSYLIDHSSAASIAEAMIHWKRSYLHVERYDVRIMKKAQKDNLAVTWENSTTTDTSRLRQLRGDSRSVPNWYARTVLLLLQSAWNGVEPWQFGLIMFEKAKFMFWRIRFGNSKCEKQKMTSWWLYCQIYPVSMCNTEIFSVYPLKIQHIWS